MADDPENELSADVTDSAKEELSADDILRCVQVARDRELVEPVPEDAAPQTTYVIDSSEGVTTFPGEDYDHVQEWLRAGWLES